MNKTKVYIFADYVNSIVKVGVTRLDTKTRIDSLCRDSGLFRFECVHAREFDGKTAYRVEKFMLDKLYEFGAKLDFTFSGSTECVYVESNIDSHLNELINHLDSVEYEYKQFEIPENNVGDVTIPKWLVQTQFISKRHDQEKPLMLTVVDKFVYSAAVSICTISQKELANSLRVSVSVVEKSVRRLVENGMLEVVKCQTGLGCIKSNSYFAKEDFIIVG